MATQTQARTTKQNNTFSPADSATPKDKLKEAYSITGEAISDIAKEAKATAGKNFDVSKEKFDEYSAKTKSFIAKNPAASMGGAFLVGLAIAKLLK